MSDELAKEWLKTKYPNMCACDVNWTMKSYDYPSYICEYIKNNWVKKNDYNGGTYHKPGYDKKCRKEEKNESQTVLESKKIKEDPSGKAAAKLYQQTAFAKEMNDHNKEALKVAAEEGIDAAAKHMMSSAGGDYARMRSMYG